MKLRCSIFFEITATVTTTLAAPVPSSERAIFSDFYSYLNVQSVDWHSRYNPIKSKSNFLNVTKKSSKTVGIGEIKGLLFAHKLCKR